VLFRSMQAATARMSISNPPIQQFPRDDPSIRGSLLADDGEVIVSADYAQVEFRVAAGVSGDPVMRHRILHGEDLHAVTATALFGPGFTQPQRQVSKPVGFGRLYLGGAPGIYKQMLEGDSTGEIPPLSRVKVAIKAFDGDYRVYYRYATRLTSTVEASGGHLVTATGRPLRVAPYYAAPNYMIQSTARDIFAAGITEIHKRGLGHTLRLVVHDEVVSSVPKAEAKEVMVEIQDAMSTVFKGIPIVADAEIKGERWKK
jgi:DNA polymerase-1